jgi:glutamate-1-semialdehyde aminotransferase
MTCANLVRYVLEKEGDVAAVIAEPMRARPMFRRPVSGKRCAKPATITARC